MTTHKPKILVLDDDPNMQDLTCHHLQANGYATVTAETAGAALNLAANQYFEVVLTDMRLPDLDGIEVVKQVKEISPTTELIVVTGYGSVAAAVEAIKAGAFYFIEKPVNYDELLLLLEKASEHREQTEEISQLRRRLSVRDSYYDIIGRSKSMQEVYELIDCVAESDTNILITGESGTGKEMVANAIHFRSRRANQKFVKINCAALPKELIESELFGHLKGAFTGATQEKGGLIAQANGGSLLLDEIGEMPLELQPKLLRVLQERVYYRIGSEKPQEADFRLITSTNCNPFDAIDAGHFREDLYYRINTIEIHISPLRERADDIQHLTEHFLKFFAEKYGRPEVRISEAAYEQLFSHHWPGNVRELQNVIERAVLMTRSETIEPEVLSIRRHVSKNAELGSPSMDGLCRLVVEKTPNSKNGELSSDIFGQLEAALVKAALERTNGNKLAASNLLGMYRPRLYSLMKKHHLNGFEADEVYHEIKDALQ